MQTQRLSRLVALLTLALLALPATAGQEEFGDYLVNYAAQPGNSIPAELAYKLGISRRSGSGFVLINLKKQQPNGLEPVPAVVVGEAKNLVGHNKHIEFREIREAGAIDYIAQFNFVNQETIVFNVTVLPKGLAVPYSVEFKQKFFIE